MGKIWCCAGMSVSFDRMIPIDQNKCSRTAVHSEEKGSLETLTLIGMSCCSCCRRWTFKWIIIIIIIGNKRSRTPFSWYLYCTEQASADLINIMKWNYVLKGEKGAPFQICQVFSPATTAYIFILYILLYSKLLFFLWACLCGQFLETPKDI